jgi:hypothetical protein
MEHLEKGIPSSPQQMARAAQTAEILGETSYWVCAAKNGVYGLYLYSPYAFPNSEFPYQFRLVTYQPGYSYLAESRQYLAGVGLDGVLQTTDFYNGWKGRLINPNQIMWNDGSIWTRTKPPADNSINQYSALSALKQAEWQSANFSAAYDRQYPNIQKNMRW